jgi:lipoate-protein ligase A
MNHPSIPGTVAGVFETMSIVFRLGLSSLGLDAGFRPKNDLTLRGRKVAGLAASNEGDDVLFFHTSMCVGFDVPTMLRLLKLPVEKLSDKGISCFSERMISIREELGRDISLGEVRSVVKDAFADYFGVELVTHGINRREKEHVQFLVKEKYTKHEWLHAVRTLRRKKGRATIKTSGGVVTADTAFTGKIIESVILSGDFFAKKEDINKIEATLKWTAAYREDILKNLRSVMKEDTIYNVSPEAVADLIFDSIQKREKY